MSEIRLVRPYFGSWPYYGLYALFLACWPYYPWNIALKYNLSNPIQIFTQIFAVLRLFRIVVFSIKRIYQISVQFSRILPPTFTQILRCLTCGHNYTIFKSQTIII